MLREYEEKLGEVSEPLPFPLSSSGRLSHLSLPKSAKSDNFWECIRPSQKHLTHQEGTQRLARAGALALGVLDLGSLPILLVCVLDPLLASFVVAGVPEFTAGLSRVCACACICSWLFQVRFPASLSFGFNSCSLLNLPLSWPHYSDPNFCFRL